MRPVLTNNITVLIIEITEYTNICIDTIRKKRQIRLKSILSIYLPSLKVRMMINYIQFIIYR